MIVTKIVGLDLSLTSTGIARIRYEDDDLESVVVHRITSKGAADASLSDRATRLRRLTDSVFGIVNDAIDPPLIVIEQPAFSRTTGHMHDRSGLWWLIVMELREHGLTVVEVGPTVRARYATGKGNASKDAVLAAVVRRYADTDVTGNDEADALVLAAMGARHLGCPIDDLPKTHLAAMTSVNWPPVTAEASA